MPTQDMTYTECFAMGCSHVASNIRDGQAQLHCDVGVWERYLEALINDTTKRKPHSLYYYSECYRIDELFRICNVSKRKKETKMLLSCIR